tara:strand:+ start:463 stop:729 length:267 start_codon:yes stop_codon:yes gene_type:complete
MNEAIKLLIIIIFISYLVVRISENSNTLIKLISIIASIIYLIKGNLIIFLIAGTIIFILSIISNDGNDKNKLLKEKKDLFLPTPKKNL